MIQIQAYDTYVEVIDDSIVKQLPYADVVKFSEGSYNNKFIVRVAHKNGLYMMYADTRSEQTLLMEILEKNCGRRS